LNFEDKEIRVNKSADDLTRLIRQPKTKGSVAKLPMPSTLASLLQNYLATQWKPNANRILFPVRSGKRPRSRRNVVRVGLHPVLRKLGIPTANTGLHAPLLAELGIRRAGFHSFRHAVASELIDSGAPISVVQTQMRHSDPRITLGIYGDVIPQSQRDAVETLADRLEGQLLTDTRIADSAA
jgi:integrase